MRSKRILASFVVCLLGAAAADAAVLRVVAVQAPDAAAYVKALEQGKALLKAKGSPVNIRIWRARYAGADAGTIVASAEYPSLEALAQDEARMAGDAELRAWLQGLDKLRKIVSDSIYQELAP